MGRYRFKLSDRILHAWFYKLRDMSSRGRSNPVPSTANNVHSRKQKQAHVSASTTAHPSKPRQSYPSNPRKSYYFTRDVTPRFELSDFHVAFETPRKSSKHKSGSRASVRSSSPKLVSSRVSSGCSGRGKLESNWMKSDSPSEYSESSCPLDTPPDPKATDTEIRTDRLLPTESLDEPLCSSSSSGCRVNSSANDIFIHVDKNSLAVNCNKLDYHDTLPELEVELPPIITKPASAKFSDMASDVKKKETSYHKTYNRNRSVEYREPKQQGPLRVKVVKEDITSTHEQRIGPVRRFSVSSPGVRLRSHSPKIASRKIQVQGRNSVSSMSNSRRNRSLSESFAVVKSSFDPQRDFRESMAEMILENNIRASKDLEDLLACYLSLNSDEYHDLIIKVFKQLWFDLIDTR